MSQPSANGPNALIEESNWNDLMFVGRVYPRIIHLLIIKVSDIFANTGHLRCRKLNIYGRVCQPFLPILIIINKSELVFIWSAQKPANYEIAFSTALKVALGRMADSAFRRSGW